MTARATRSAKPGSIAALVGAAALVVALATPAGAQEAALDPRGPTTADVALCWGLLAGGVGAILAAYNWQGGDPDRTPPPPPPDLVSRPNLLIIGMGGVVASVWQCKRVGDKRRRARLELELSGIRLSW